MRTTDALDQRVFAPSDSLIAPINQRDADRKRIYFYSENRKERHLVTVEQIVVGIEKLWRGACALVVAVCVKRDGNFGPPVFLPPG